MEIDNLIITPAMLATLVFVGFLMGLGTMYVAIMVSEIAYQQKHDRAEEKQQE